MAESKSLLERLSLAEAARREREQDLDRERRAAVHGLEAEIEQLQARLQEQEEIFRKRERCCSESTWRLWTR